MREHLHVDQLTGRSPRGLDGLEGDRVMFAGMDAAFLTGGSGFATPAPPPTANGTVVAGRPAAHHSVIALVLFAVVILFILDRLGFRFAVTAGRR